MGVRELLELLHSAGDLVALIVTALLAWAALFLLGPLLCAGVVVFRAAGHPPPADATLLFLGTAGSWALAFAGTLVARAVRITWARLRESTAREARARGRKAAEDIRRAPRPVTAASHARAHRPARRRVQGRSPDPPPPRAPMRPAAPEPDPRAVLGVPKGATQDAIRRAYRDLVKKYHPDRVADLPLEFRTVAHQKTMEIRRAYEALTRTSGPA